MFPIFLGGRKQFIRGDKDHDPGNRSEGISASDSWRERKGRFLEKQAKECYNINRQNECYEMETKDGGLPHEYY